MMDNSNIVFDWTDCVEDIKSGNQEAFEFLYNKTYSSLKKRILFRTGFNEQDAEDILQETYIRAYKGIDQLSEPNAIMGWLQTICDRTCLNVIEKNSRRDNIAIIQLESDMASEDEDSDNFSLEMIESPNNVEKEIDQKEVQRLLATIINGLPPLHCSCLQMQMEDRSIKEIMEETGLPEGTVKTYLFKAKKFIKAKVKELEKQGTKLYGLAPLPFFYMLYKQFMLRGEEVPVNAEEAVTQILHKTSTVDIFKDKGINATVRTASSTSAPKAGISVEFSGKAAVGINAAATGTSSTGVSATAGLGVGKIIGIVAAAVLVTGGITAGVIAASHAVNNIQEQSTDVQEEIITETATQETSSEVEPISVAETTEEKIIEKDVTEECAKDEDLKRFLENLTFYANDKYDSEDDESQQNILWSIIGGSNLPCINWENYPISSEDMADKPSNLKISEKTYNWVANYIFNVDDESIETFKQNMISDEGPFTYSSDFHYVKYEDGFYESYWTGLGGFGSRMIKIDNAILNEDLYDIQYYMIFNPGEEEYTVKRYNVKLQHKDTEYGDFWSLYNLIIDDDRSGLDRLEEEYKNELLELLQGVWKDVYSKNGELDHLTIENDKILKYHLESGSTNPIISELSLKYVDKTEIDGRDCYKFYLDAASSSYELYLDDADVLISYVYESQTNADGEFVGNSVKKSVYEKYDSSINDLLGITLNKPTESISADVADSYISILKQKADSIKKASEEIDDARSKNNVAIFDINGDEIPEMITLEYDGLFGPGYMNLEGDYYKVSAHIYAFIDGTIEEISSDEEIDNFTLTDYPSQDRVNSIIYFKKSGSDDVYWCITKSPGMTIEMLAKFNDDFSSEPIASANLRFGRNETIEDSLNNMSEIILIGDPSGEFGNYDAPLSGMTYDEAINYLQSML